MPISGTALLAMSESKMAELFRLCQPTTCRECGRTLHESTTGCRVIDVDDGTCACSDCYFRTFSEELDEHPIGIPRMHRGG